VFFRKRPQLDIVLGVVKLQDNKHLFDVVGHAEIDGLKRTPENTRSGFILDPFVRTSQVEFLRGVLNDYFHAQTIQKANNLLGPTPKTNYANPL
jgi:hypothetical protein